MNVSKEQTGLKIEPNIESLEHEDEQRKEAVTLEVLWTELCPHPDLYIDVRTPT